MSKNKIRIGVISTANIALRSVIPAIQQLNDCYELVAVASRSASVANPALASLNIIEGYDNLLKENLDAVYIPLPNSLHYAWVKECLKRGIHVLVEKSLACSYEEVVELNQLAEEKNLAIVENFQFRFHSQLAYIKSILADKILGDLRIVRSTFCFPPFPDKTNIRYQKELGGGVLLDAAAYPVKISQLILGNDLKVTTATLNYDSYSGVDIWGGASLQQTTGKLFSQIAFGFDNYYQCNVEIVGSKGRLYTNRIFTANEQVKPKIILETQEKGFQEIELETDNHFKNMLLYFHQLIEGREDKTKEYADNINQSRLLKELKQKAHEQ